MKVLRVVTSTSPKRPLFEWTLHQWEMEYSDAEEELKRQLAEGEQK
jgi:hypothetical protein